MSCPVTCSNEEPTLDSGTNSILEIDASVATASSSSSLSLPADSELDIAKGVHDSPVQSRNHQLPASQFGVKNRSSNPMWFSKYSWLEYSIKRDAAFCYACRNFSTSTVNDDVFVKTGHTNWKHAAGKSGKLEKHNTSLTQWLHGVTTTNPGAMIHPLQHL